MSILAEEKAVEYQIKTHGPNVMGGASMLSEEEYVRFNMNLDFKNGYEQAEKDTIDYACYELELRLPEYLNYNGIQVERAEFIKDFCKAMEDEKWAEQKKQR